MKLLFDFRRDTAGSSSFKGTPTSGMEEGEHGLSFVPPPTIAEGLDEGEEEEEEGQGTIGDRLRAFEEAPTTDQPFRMSM